MGIYHYKMTDNICIEYPKCNETQRAEGGECNNEDLKFAPTKNKCVLPNSNPLMTFINNKNVFKDNSEAGDCYMHPALWEDYQTKNQSYTNEIDELICKDNNNKIIDEKIWPSHKTKCTLGKEIECETNDDCDKDDIKNYCRDKAKKFIPKIKKGEFSDLPSLKKWSIR